MNNKEKLEQIKLLAHESLENPKQSLKAQVNNWLRIENDTIQSSERPINVIQMGEINVNIVKNQSLIIRLADDLLAVPELDFTEGFQSVLQQYLEMGVKWDTLVRKIRYAYFQMAYKKEMSHAKAGILLGVSRETVYRELRKENEQKLIEG